MPFLCITDAVRAFLSCSLLDAVRPSPPRAALIFYEEGASDVPPLGLMLEAAGAFRYDLDKVADLIYSSNPMEVDDGNLVLGSYSCDIRQEDAILSRPRIMNYVVEK